MSLKSGEGASSSSRSSWEYDVFVSFRGKDTRKNFTDHLFRALDLKGIDVFRDDQKLERGKLISPELVKAIEASRLSIVVFSRKYATSSWCLDELLEIVKCKKDVGQTVYPVFYKVTPTDVRKQTGSFKKAFDQYHKKALGAEKLEKWRAALTEVANLAGYDLQDGYEAEFIKKIVEDVWTKLYPSLISKVTKGLVGIDSLLKDMISYLDEDLSDVRIIGICGMAGIGKTTIAKAIYNFFSRRFKDDSIFFNVKESHEKFGEIYKRQYEGKVLLVLDDVDKCTQLKTLVRNRESFGQGSRIIITTIDKQVLKASEVDRIYEVELLDWKEALQLFSLNAFKQNHPDEDFMELSTKIIYYAHGLPLSLVVLGSLLYDTSVDMWISVLKRLEENSTWKIFDVLKTSYDSLEELEKKIFLDISCPLYSKEVNRVTEILDACDFHPKIGLKALVDKSLISIDEHSNKFHVHSLLQEMARTIICEGSPPESGKDSRLWLYNDIYRVLTNKSDTKEVEVIYLSSYKSREMFLEVDTFLEMHKLRILKIHDVKLPKGLDFLPNELRILNWHGYPLKSLPSTFKPHKLTELRMSHSDIQLLWKETMYLDRLKVIELSHSKKLIRTPDFRDVPNLDKLILEGCTSLREVHPSIGNLQRLSVLNLKDCENLQSLPRIVSGWRSLKVLLLLGCSKIDKLPENLGDCKDLKELDAGKTAITEAPASIVNLKNLKKLSFGRDKGRTLKRWNWFLPLLADAGPSSVSFSLPSQMAGLSSLTELDLSYCDLSTIPSDIGSLSALYTLDLRGNSFVSLPASIDRLSSLLYLKLDDCRELQTLSELPSSIKYIGANNCSSLKTLIGPLALSRSGERFFAVQNCFRLLENRGDDDVAVSLLKQQLEFFAKKRIREIFSDFLDLFECQESHDPNIATFIRSWMSYLPQAQILEAEAFHWSQIRHTPDLMIFLPGGFISDWFTNETSTNSITIELRNTGFAFLGVAVGATVRVKDHIPKQIKTKGWIRFRCTGYYRGCEACGRIIGSDTVPRSDHLWLLFLPSQADTWPGTFYGEFSSEGPHFEFKKCGVRAVYLEDVEFFQTMFQGVNVPQLEDIVQLCESPEASGSGSSDEDEDNDETRDSIDPKIELKGKRIQE